MSFDADIVVRIVAALAAVALVASPVVVAAWEAAVRWAQQRQATTPEDLGLAEMRIVLDLAAKLRAAGNYDGVDLCQKLLDCMLKPSAKPGAKT